MPLVFVRSAALVLSLSCSGEVMETTSSPPPPPSNPPAGAPLGRYAFTSVTVVPMDRERALPNHTVLVDGTQIVAVGPDGTVTIPDGTTQIDGKGQWLSPGLVDFHTHERALPDWPDDVAGNFIMYLANGITSIVNMGDLTGKMIPFVKEVDDGKLAGPNVYVGRFVRGPSDGGNPVVATAEDARKIARDARAEGYDFLKIYDGVPTVAYDALAEEAAVLGLPIVGHVVRQPGLAYALEHGQRMIVHATALQTGAFNRTNSPEMIPAVVQMFLRAGAVFSPTLYVSEVITDFGLDGISGADQYARVLRQEGVEYMDDRALEGWRTMLQQRGDVRAARDRRPDLAFMMQFIKAFHDAGIPTMMGSDEIGIPGVVPGFSIHGELRLLHEAGLTRFQTLTTGTRVPGAFIRQYMRPTGPRFGTVEPGTRADLVLLDRDPVDDLTAFREPVGVMTAGRWYPKEWLVAQMDSLRRKR